VLAGKKKPSMADSFLEQGAMMAKLIDISEEELNHFFSKPNVGQKYCEELEEGNILFFSKYPFEFPQEELDFLLSQKQTGAENRKNIAYKPQANKMTNFVRSSPEQEERLLQIMRLFSQRTARFLSRLLTPYSEKWRLDYASFRPFEEESRSLRTRARNDLLHVDAFPTRPLHGSRILRFFININPKESRLWTTSLPFDQLALTFGGKQHGVPFPKGVSATLGQKILTLSKKGAQKLGLPIVLRSPYDTFMLQFHHFLKENNTFQQSCHKDFWEFPPQSCWAVFTDKVSHAATAGQYALEQTLIIPTSALVQPAKAPVAVLERLASKPMVDHTLL
jgi:3-deoxy-D-manno-oct-2-ulosonic acid (Kdo) hydroxylase